MMMGCLNSYELSRRQAVSVIIFVRRNLSSFAHELKRQRSRLFHPAYTLQGTERVPAEHSAQPVDLSIARPLLWALQLSPDVNGYRLLFGEAYLGSDHVGGALGRAARRHAEVRRCYALLQAYAEALVK